MQYAHVSEVVLRPSREAPCERAGLEVEDNVVGGGVEVLAEVVVDEELDDEGFDVLS